MVQLLAFCVIRLSVLQLVFLPIFHRPTSSALPMSESPCTFFLALIVRNRACWQPEHFERCFQAPTPWLTSPDGRLAAAVLVRCGGPNER